MLCGLFLRAGREAARNPNATVISVFSPVSCSMPILKNGLKATLIKRMHEHTT